MILLILGTIAAVGLIIGFIALAVPISLALEKGPALHPGRRLASKRVLMLCGDMRHNPNEYSIGEHVLTSERSGVCIWVANGYGFFEDYCAFGKPPNPVGPMSLWDRWVFMRALKTLKKGRRLTAAMARQADAVADRRFQERLGG